MIVVARHEEKVLVYIMKNIVQGQTFIQTLDKRGCKGGKNKHLHWKGQITRVIYIAKCIVKMISKYHNGYR